MQVNRPVADLLVSSSVGWPRDAGHEAYPLFGGGGHDQACIQLAFENCPKANKCPFSLEALMS